MFFVGQYNSELYTNVQMEKQNITLEQHRTLNCMLFQDRMEDGKSSMDVKYLFQFIG
jgi:hypothetical protein